MGGKAGVSLRVRRGTLNNLSATALATLKPGVHTDGGGLYLRVFPAGSRRWIYAWKADGRRTELGLGTFPAVSLATARRLAAGHRDAIAAGRDPAAERKSERRTAARVTFADVMDDYLATKVAALRNPKHRAQWRSTLETYAASVLPMPVADVRTEHVLDALNPIWRDKPETASRVRGRLESILNAAKARGLRSGENPAAWRGHLANLLPARNKRLDVRHFAARPWGDMPALMAQLEAAQSMSALCLRWIVLTACRSGEGRGARWNEIDMAARVWTIPPARTKTANAHRVPLSEAAMRVLETVRPLAGDADALVFPGGRVGRPLSDVAVTKALRGLDPVATVHGMRSAFRDWVGEATHFPREVAEQAMAHVVGNEAERAYRRGDALEKRRALMAAWADYLAGRPAANVVALRA